MKKDSTSKISENRLREFRITPRISQWQLSLISGVKQSRISLIENCLVHPTLKEKARLSEALQHPIEDIFPSNNTHSNPQL